MSPSTTADALLKRVEATRLNGEIRTLAAEQGKDQGLATRLWESEGFRARMLALLMFDLKAVDVPQLQALVDDIEAMEGKEQSQLCDWLVANVIMKKAALRKESMTWRRDASVTKQRLFWSVQARSVRSGNDELNEALLGHIERDLASAPEHVQWNMNWCAAQIGIADPRVRERCIALGSGWACTAIIRCRRAAPRRSSPSGSGASWRRRQQVETSRPAAAGSHPGGWCAG
jgi:3-methyladenine DNA glycosylase AlkD